MRQFIVTGSGRCGTAWIARALTTLGLRCSHEGIFNPHTLGDGSWRRRLDRGVCGASWLALGVLDEIPREVAIVVLVRSPLDVIRSLRGIRFFAEPNEYTRIARSVFALPEEPIEAAAWFWIEANRRALTRAEAVVRIESPDLRTVINLVDPDREILDEHIASAARLQPMNSRTRDESITLDMLESGTRNALSEMAMMLGYDAASVKNS